MQYIDVENFICVGVRSIISRSLVIDFTSLVFVERVFMLLCIHYRL